MTNEEIAEQIAEQISEQLYDELQHNKIANCEEFNKRLYELLDKAHNGKFMDGYAIEIEDIMHSKWCFGFCDMCGDVIFYDDDAWYDLCGELFDYERERIEERLPQIQKELGHGVQDVCATCFHKLTKGK